MAAAFSRCSYPSFSSAERRPHLESVIPRVHDIQLAIQANGESVGRISSPDS